MTAVEWLVETLELSNPSKQYQVEIDKAKEMEEEQRGYSESDMRSYASYILNNPVIEPSQWYKIYRTK